MLRFDERVHLPKNRENTITFLVNGEPIGTVETLAPGAKTVDIPIPPVDYDSVTSALGYVPYNSTNPNNYITSSALNGYATETWVGQQGYAKTNQIPTAISDLVDDTATTPIDKAESVVDNNSGSLKFWSGTKAQYDAIVTKDADTLYNITDDANPTLSILEMLYPVGSIYIGTMSACPLQTLGVGTWQLKTSRFLVEKKEPDSNDNRWYNLYSDGYCEQGGIITIPLDGSTRIGYATPTFIKRFRDTNDVSAFAQGGYIPSVSGMAYNVNNVTTSSMRIQAITVDRTSATSGTPNPCYYRVSGYILQTSIVNQWERIS